ncbi:MAG: DUF5060 domain-containing protein [Anaerolineales bacterium]
MRKFKKSVVFSLALLLLAAACLQKPVTVKDATRQAGEVLESSGNYLEKAIETATSVPTERPTQLPTEPPADQPMVVTYRVFELSLTAQDPGTNAYLEGPSLEALFQGESGLANGQQMIVKGFWDGADTWIVRFAPPATGVWTYQTSSPDPGLDGVSGSLIAVPPEEQDYSQNPLLHGFLEADGDAWKLSDGTPFLPVGDTQWSFSEEVTSAEWQQWVDARSQQSFNSFLGSVWLAKYDRPEATLPPFPDQDPKSDQLQVAYFQRLDQMVQYANDHGIVMGLAIGGFPGNTQWFDRFGTRERNDRWFQYIVARYSAYNVRWILYGEVNEKNPPWGTTWQEEVAHSAGLVKTEDPYDHPIGSHHTEVDTSCAVNTDIDYIEAQVDRDEQQYITALALREYGKPIWFEEYWYEPEVYDNDVALGIRNTHRNFISALAFPTFGSLMRAHYPDFDIGEVSTDPGAMRMSYFARFYQGLEYKDFSSASDLVSRGQCGRFGDNYAIFLEGGGEVALDLSNASGAYAVQKLDINSGQVTSLGIIQAGGTHKIDTNTTSDVSLLAIKQLERPLNFDPAIYLPLMIFR